MKDTRKSGLVAWWQFDEGEGAVLNDHSGNNNHGTIQGATWFETVPIDMPPALPERRPLDRLTTCL